MIRFILILFAIYSNLFSQSIEIEDSQYINDSTLTYKFNGDSIYLERNKIERIEIKNSKCKYLFLSNDSVHFVNIIENHFENLIVGSADVSDNITGIQNYYNQLTIIDPGRHTDTYAFRGDTINSLFIGSYFGLNLGNKNFPIDSNKNKWDLLFYNCIFLGDIRYYVYPSEFPRRLSFFGCEFRNELIFGFCNLPETLDFSYVKTMNEINLTYTFIDSLREFDQSFKCNLILDDAEIEKFNLFYDNFHLTFNEYNCPYEKKLHIYQRLLDNFKKRGYTNSYNMLDEEYKNFILYNDFNVGLFLEKYWWNYGHSKGRIFYITLSLLFALVIINAMFIDKYLVNIYHVKNINHILKNDLKKNYQSKIKKCIGDSWTKLRCSFFYTTLIFFSFKLNTDNMNFRKYWGVAYIYLIYILGLFCTVFIVNYFLFK